MHIDIFWLRSLRERSERRCDDNIEMDIKKEDLGVLIGLIWLRTRTGVGIL
jgi:hypothetical protein